MQDPTILYEDEAIIVVDKPSGMSVHTDGKHDYPTLVAWLIVQYPELVGVGEVQTLPSGEVIERPGIVHRLDRETSGVLVVARTQASFDSLKEQFHDRETRKTYRAFVYGNLKDERGIINKPIGSGRGGVGPRSARAPHGEVRDALTMYKVLANSAPLPLENRAAYVEVFPKTGRTHQIRVHFSLIQHPIVGDVLYGSRRAPLLGFTRLALHAYNLTFTHPTTGKEVTYTAPLPPDFVAAEAALRGQA
jgi:23S rRNA pseudouridine1911/1915/1917 synthase